MHALSVKGLVKTYRNGVQALKGIDLDIRKGEYVALMGPSGSGKSTLMNLLGCLDTPTSGSYILNGKDVSKMHDDELADLESIKHQQPDQHRHAQSGSVSRSQQRVSVGIAEEPGARP